ncbi:MAG: hypothetical protein NUW12_04445 [Firmicutes bacterium]|nr:hypothetical protein [Bacillota bacterium]MDH7495197.1 hypothetical protein [Bacillota bacterium]
MTSERHGWCIVEDELDLAKAGHRETVCALGNGYLGVRGAPEEGHPGSTPATFIAGVFDTAPGGVPELVVAPNWLRMRITVDGEEFGMARGELLSFRRTLDMREGILERAVRWRGSRGRTVRFTWRRLVSMADIHVGAVSLSIEPEDSDVEVVVDCAIDGRVSNARAVHLDVVEQGRHGEASYVVARTRSSGVTIAEAQIVEAFGGDAGSEGCEPCPAATWVSHDTGSALLKLTCRRGERVAVEKYVGFGTSLDAATSDCCDVADPLALALSAARRGAERRFAGLLEEHRRVWRDIWDRCDIVIEGDDFAQRAARFAMFHMVQAAPRHTDRVSIGARGLSGEGYKGHVFWDTETFVVPFFTFTLPEVARNLLGYRYNTLAAARRNAASKGYRGAMFAWESADTGEETTPSWGDPDPLTGARRRILCGDLEHHITADVAYAVWQYCMATGDEEFLLRRGAEIIIETGRFWASRASYNPSTQAYEILHVIGPDEYHEDVNNNYYTNAMARWNIRAALALSNYLMASHPAEWSRLVSAIGINHDELAHMADVARRLVCGRALFAPEPFADAVTQDVPGGKPWDRAGAGGQREPLVPGAPVIEQFDGFRDLADVVIKLDGPEFRPMETVIGPEAVARSQVVKQPDVLMALYLLGESVADDISLAGETCAGGADGEVGAGGDIGTGGETSTGGGIGAGGGIAAGGGHALPLRHPAGASWKEVVRANWDYYEPRTDHGSSLSCAIHSTIASMLGLDEEAWRYFERAARIDLADAMGNSANGIHMATQGGLWQAIVNGFAGIQAPVSVPRERDASLSPWAGGTLRVDPRLPGRWRRLSATLTWRGTRMRVEFDGSCHTSVRVCG